MLTRLLVSVAALASYAAAQSSSSGSIIPNATISSSGSFFPNVTASSTGNIIPNATVSSTGIFPNVTASSTGMMNTTSSTGVMPPMNMTSSTGVMPPMNMTSSTGVMPPMNMTSSTGVMPPMSSTGPSGMVSCMGAGYDLSSIANMDLTLDDGDYTWAVRPCGTVSADLELCDGQMCQDDTVISRYEPALVNWYAIDGGVNLEVQNGDDSGCNGPRESDINFICNATSLTPRLVSVVEDTQCHYRAIIHTAAACTRNTSWLPGVGDAFTSPVCGGNAYDLSSLNSRDITGEFGGWNWTVRVCGPVSEPMCASAQPLSVCQHAGDEVWKLANYGATLPLYEINPNGLNMSLESGQSCGDSGNRTTFITFDCDPLATTPVMTEASEYYVCEYWFRIRTSAVCGAPFQARSSSSGLPMPTSSSTGLPMPSSSAAPTIPPVLPSSSSASFPIDSSSSVPVFPTDSSSSEPTIPDFSSSDIFEPFSSTGEDLENPGLNGAASVSISGVVLLVSMMAALAL